MAGILKFVANYTISISGNPVLCVSSGMTNVVFKAQPEEIITHTASEVATGVYIAAGNITSSAYKLYINGVVNTSWGGSNGGYAANSSWATDDELTIVSAGRVDRAGDTITGDACISYANSSGTPGSNWFDCITLTGGNASAAGLSAIPSKGYVDNKFGSSSGSLSGAYVTLATNQNITNKKAFSGGTTFELGTSATTATAFRITTASNPPNGGVVALDVGYQNNNIPRFDFYNSDMQVKSVTASTVSSSTAYLNYVDVYKTGTQNVFRVRADVAFTGLPKTAIQIYGGSDNTVIDFANSTIVNFNQTDLPDVIGSKQRHVNATFPSNLVNKRYQYFTDAVGSCTTPGVENQYDIMVHNTGGTISGTTANISNVSYINYIGLGNPRVLLQANSFSKNAIWRDLKLKREDASLTFTNLTFENCEIYIKNVFVNSALSATFDNCRLKNCIISVDYRVGAAITFSGGSNEVYNTILMGATALSFAVGDSCSNTAFNSSVSADWS